MKSNSFIKKFVFLPLILLFLLTTTLACVEIFKQKPEDVIKRYWELSTKGNFKEASELACGKNNCEGKTNAKAVDINGNILDSDYGINLCCSYKMIFERKLILKEIIDISTSKKYAAVKIEAEAPNKNSMPYLSCLEKDNNGNWKIRSLNYDTKWIDYDLGDPCYVKMDGGKQPSNKQSE